MTNLTANASANYSEDMINTMTSAYSEAPTRATVDSLASQFNKSARSIIAKLSALGIYQKAERVTKAGAPVVLKAEIVAELLSELGTTDAIPSLEKVSKADLQRLLALVQAR